MRRRGEVQRVITGAGGFDSTGEPKPGTETLETITGCVVWQSGGSDSQEVGVTTVEDMITINLPAGQDAETGDVFIFNGRRYKAVAASFPWKSPLSGRDPGVTVKARRVEPGARP